MKTIRAVIVCLALAASAGSALADGVPLLTTGRALSANDPVRQLDEAKSADVVKVYSATFNKNAFGSNILNVNIEGKEYRFVGAMMAKYPHRLRPQEKRPNTSAWSGKEPGGGSLVLTKDLDTGGMLGQIILPPARRFQIMSPGGRVILIEYNRNLETQVQTYVPPASSATGRPK